MPHSNVRITPDSTGKRLIHRALLDLTYNSGVTDFVIGDTVIGATSGITGTVIEVSGTTNTGSVQLQLDLESPQLATVGEFLQVLGVTKANALTGGTAYYIPSANIVSSSNSHLGLNINRFGAAITSFSEGQPTLDGVGQLRVATPVVLGSYDFVAGPQDSLFWDEVANGGSVAHDNQNSYMLLSTGTLSGSKGNRVTHRYHYYQPGTGILVLLSLAVGDTGKANNVREWGVGDAENGLFFSLIGTTLGVTVRTNTSGSVVNTFIAQENWNADKVDGTGLSKFNFDITKKNLFWIDYLWLGSGAIRFGVFGDNNERIVCHNVSNANGLPTPYMRSASLPVAFFNYNTGVTASTSELRYICSAIYSESQTDYMFWRFSDMENTSLRTITTDTPLLSVRSKTLDIGGGTPNRVGVYPDTLAIYVTGGPVKIDWIFGADTLTDDTWSLTGIGTVEGDEAATAITYDPSAKMYTHYVPLGVTNIDMKPYWETNDIGITLHADAATQIIHSIVVTKLNPGDTVTARCTLTYRELS